MLAEVTVNRADDVGAARHGVDVNLGADDRERGACCDEEQMAELGSDTHRRAQWVAQAAARVGRRRRSDLAVFVQPRTPRVRASSRSTEAWRLSIEGEPFDRPER